MTEEALTAAQKQAKDEFAGIVQLSARRYLDAKRANTPRGDPAAANATTPANTAPVKPAFGLTLNVGKVQAKAAAGDGMKDADGNQMVMTESYRLVPVAEANKAATAVQQSARAWMAAKGEKSFGELRPEKQAAVREIGVARREGKKLHKQQLSAEQAAVAVQQSARAWMAAKGKKRFTELRPEKQAAVREIGLAQRQEKRMAKQKAKSPEEAASYLQLSARGFLQAKRAVRANTVSGSVTAAEQPHAGATPDRRKT